MLIGFFDLATVTGYAFGNESGVAESGLIKLPRTGDDFGLFLREALANYGLILDRLRPDSVWYEAPMLPGTTALQTLRKLYTLPPALELSAQRRQIAEVRESQRQEILQHFLGEGRVPRRREKRQIAVKVECRRRGWKPVDDNEADALAGLDYAIACKVPAHALKQTGLFGT